ncbi:MAG: hypothetical protein ACR2L2_10705 [Acidobacteriota bacterium]
MNIALNRTFQSHLTFFSSAPSLRPLHYQLAKSCLSKIFDPASFLPARSLPAAALLALRRRPAVYGIRHTAYGCGNAALRLCGKNHLVSASNSFPSST